MYDHSEGRHPRVEGRKVQAVELDDAGVKPEAGGPSGAGHVAARGADVTAEDGLSLEKVDLVRRVQQPSRGESARNTPLRQQRDLANLQLGALPAKREEPGTDEIDVEAFRATVPEAWTDEPTDLRRGGLDPGAQASGANPLERGHCLFTTGSPEPRLGGSGGQWTEAIDMSDVRAPRLRA